MPPKFDFFDDLSVKEQNHFLRKYLIEDTKYLNPTPFKSSPGFFFYHAVYYDQKQHHNTSSNLASLLVLLISREFIWPIQFHSNNHSYPINSYQPFFVFTSDIKELDDSDFGSFKYRDLAQDARVLLN